MKHNMRRGGIAALALTLLLTGCGQTSGQAAGQGLYDWSEKDQDDFRRRKQGPYFDGVREWTMPE